MNPIVIDPPWYKSVTMADLNHLRFWRVQVQGSRRCAAMNLHVLLATASFVTDRVCCDRRGSDNPSSAQPTAQSRGHVLFLWGGCRVITGCNGMRPAHVMI